MDLENNWKAKDIGGRLRDILAGYGYTRPDQKVDLEGVLLQLETTHRHMSREEAFLRLLFELSK